MWILIDIVLIYIAINNKFILAYDISLYVPIKSLYGKVELESVLYQLEHRNVIM